MEQQRALFIFPLYSVPSLDARTFTVLQKCNILPPDFGIYNRTGYREDQQKIMKHFPYKDVIIPYTFHGEVLRNDLFHIIQETIRDPCSLLMIIYCGHGYYKDGEYHLSLSYNQMIHEGEVHAILRAHNFNGTLVQLMNVCDYDGRSDLNISESSCVTSVVEGYNHYDIIGVSKLSDIADRFQGSMFIEHISRVLETNDKPTYGMLMEYMSENFPVHCKTNAIDVLSSLRFGDIPEDASTCCTEIDVDGFVREIVEDIFDHITESIQMEKIDCVNEIS